MPFLFLALIRRAGIKSKEQVSLRIEFLFDHPKSTLKIDHAPWSKFLKKYLDAKDESGVNLMRYKSVDKAGVDALNDYIDYLQELPIRSYSRTEQLPYWINLYNALTVQLILDHYPVDSITDIQSGFFSFGPWDEHLLVIEDQSVSLNDIEHRILRPIWDDPRLHYALNCASMGCPNLLPEAYEVESANKMMDQAAKEFINHYRAVRFERTRLVLSKIFSWYMDDFGGNEKELLVHISKFARPTLQRALEEYKGKIEYDYDWSLNAK